MFCYILYSAVVSRAGNNWGIVSLSDYIIHLMYGPEGNSQFCSPDSPHVSRDEVEGNIRTRGKQN